MYIILAILIFCLLIFSHELGHFMAARASGVRVLEFSMGMGPALWKKQRGETLYAIRCLPLGGYCALEGEDESSEDPRAFTNAVLPKKLLILVAGVAMNFLVGFVIVLVLFSGKSFSAPVITGFMEGCPYENAEAFQQGDRFYRVNGERVYFSGDVSRFLQRGEGTPEFEIIRNGEKRKFTLEMQPREYEYQGQTGTYYGFLMEQLDSGPLNHLRYSWYQSLDFVRMVRMGLTDLVTGAVSVKEVSGVVGIVDTINQVGQQAPTARDALWSIGYLTALVSMNLAVMNLLPIPALDGGRIVFLLIGTLVAKIRGRQLDPKYEGWIHGVTLILLIGLMVVVMFNDVARVVTR